MKPNFSLFRALYARIAAKPESMVYLNAYRGPRNDCGTPYCVLGELCCMPEANLLGLELWAGCLPRYGDEDIHGEGSPGSLALGITDDENDYLFAARRNRDITEKQEALNRIEKLFADHGEPLHQGQIPHGVASSGAAVSDSVEQTADAEIDAAHPDLVRIA